ncbi:DUF423 domain-containing protein [Legionella feeleii]|uniref:Protein of uncharacterized function (DUF423) n=1 Tax=Legionella feeleii TaxID=453 RepID=A0A0W0UAD0_9GAMM|nr:DUF423 domain-containing protein [Legionella feeleii]KTD04900.1 hypothetical protein Lfee_0038 [Legionella feeleii]SPX62198.1 Protein of uncharacterised function (DUF423) [Legionella feeleii]STX37839.1 Protein of uncharacterised function (DUF423) [Legionella feeleii]
MMKLILVLASILGLSSVMLGALESHVFGAMLTLKNAQRFGIALHCQQLYSILLVALSLYGLQRNPPKLLHLVCVIFLLGVFIFSGSLYALIFLAKPIFRYGTPCGGALLMLGWILLLLFSMFYKPQNGR